MDTPSLIEEQNQYILENIRDIIFTLSPDGIIKSVTREFENLTGWSREEWIGRHFLDIVHPDDTTVVIEGFKATIRGETLPPYHARIFTKSGDILILEAKPTPHIVNGQVVGYLGIARDITERKRVEDELRASEQQYRNMINSMGDPIHVIDKDLKIILANPTFSIWLKQLNLDIKLVGKTIREAFPFLPDNVIDEYQTVFLTGKTLITEEGTTINGTTYFTETRKIPIIRQEEVVQILTIIRDITERKKIEDQLRESEQKYRDLISNLTEMVAETDAEGNFIFLSPQALDIFGYHPEELIGKNSFDFIHPDDMEDAMERLKETLTGKQIFNYEYRATHRKGHYISIAVSGKAIEQDDNLKLVFVLRDITERKRMEKSLRESETHNRQIIENIQDIVFTLSAEGTVTSVNPAFDRITGWAPNKNIGKPFTSMIHPDDVPGALKALKAISQGELSTSSEVRLLTKSGSYSLVEGKVTPQFKHGKVIGYFGVARDVSERKKAEMELIKTKKRLEYLLKECPAVIYSCTPDGHFETTFMSENIEEILGHKAENFINKPDFWEGNLHPGEREHVVTTYNEITKKGYYSDSYRFKHKNGSYRWMFEEANLIYDDYGKPLEVVGFWTDITKQKEAEERLKQSEEQYRTLFENIPIGLYRSTPDHRFLAANSTFIKQVGLSSLEELCKITAETLAAKRKYPRDRFLMEINEKGEVKGLEFRFKGSDGTSTYIRENARAIKDSDGSILYYEGSVEDITDRVLAEEALRENEERFRSIFENSPIGMVLANLDFRFVKVNRAFCHMLEYEENELLQMTFSDITHEDHHEMNNEYAKKLVKGDIPSYQREERYLKKNQEIFWVRVTVSLLQDNKGDPINFITMVEDITAIRQRDEEIKKQLLKYDVDDGNIYLVTEETPTISQTVFKDLTAVGYKGSVISRTPEKDYRTHMEGKYNFFWLTEKNGYKKLLAFVEEAPNKSVILVDRLEYLFLKEGTENAIRFVFKLRETTYLKNLIVILSIDSTTLTERELRILEKETYQIKPRFMAKIAEEFLEVLRLIYQQNNLLYKPSYSDIGEELQISRPTVRKRIKQLLATGYLIEHKKGKSKILEISGKGRRLFLT